MTEYIRCTDCPADWVVSKEDPDATLSEVLAHVARHGVPARQAHHHFEEGVNRCREGICSTPHKGCILR